MPEQDHSWQDKTGPPLDAALHHVRQFLMYRTIKNPFLPAIIASREAERGHYVDLKSENCRKSKRPEDK
jgi:hypothetical protein